VFPHGKNVPSNICFLCWIKRCFGTGSCFVEWGESRLNGFLLVDTSIFLRIWNDLDINVLVWSQLINSEMISRRNFTRYSYVGVNQEISSFSYQVDYKKTIVLTPVKTEILIISEYENRSSCYLLRNLPTWNQIESQKVEEKPKTGFLLLGDPKYIAKHRILAWLAYEWPK
jgi:hypothetical protein